jgi:hypothetical protein
MRVFVTGASDRRAIEIFGEVLAGSDRPLAIASGVAGLKPGGIATERDEPNHEVSPRVASEQAALALAERGVRSMSVRFAPTVHGTGDHGFIARIIDADRSHGARFGFIGQFIGLDMPASSVITRELLGWEPTGPTLVEDIQAGAYSNHSQD